MDVWSTETFKRVISGILENIPSLISKKRAQEHILVISKVMLSNRTFCDDGNVLYLCHPMGSH